MANKVLRNFLIGVGLDTEKYDKGAKKVEGSLGRMRTLVGFTGAAIAGAFAFAGTAAIGAGKRIDDFNLATEGLKTSRQYVYDYGRALVALGGNADDAVEAIKSIEKAQSDFTLKGQLGPLEDVALARGDINELSQAKDGKEFLRTLAPMVQNMNKDQQRMVQDALGLSDSVMRSLRGGLAEFDAAIARAHDLAGNLDSAVSASREFNRTLAELNTRFEGIGNTLAEKILPGFSGVLSSLGGFIDRNRDLVDKGAELLGSNPAATTLAAGGGAASATGVALRGIGLRGIGAGLTRLGTPGMIAGGGLMAYDAAKNWEWGDWWQQSADSARDSWRGITGQNDHSALPDAPFGPEVPTVPVYAGGEVSNAEAAKASPDVILLQDQRQQAERPAAPQRVNVQNNLDVKLELDGRHFESKVTEVVERRERNTADDLISSVER